MDIFVAEQKIVKSFDRNPSVVYLRREIFLYFKMD